jgi:hypothetical protein
MGISPAKAATRYFSKLKRKAWPSDPTYIGSRKSGVVHRRRGADLLNAMEEFRCHRRQWHKVKAKGKLRPHKRTIGLHRRLDPAGSIR